MVKQNLSINEIRAKAEAIIYDFVATEANKHDISKLREYKQATIMYRSTVPKPTQIAVEQKLTKPPLTEIVEKQLAGEVKDNLLDLVDYCNSLKMTPKWYAANHYHFKYKGKVLWYLNIGDGIADLSGFYNIMMNVFDARNTADIEKGMGLLSEDMRGFYLKNLKYCNACNSEHDHEKSYTILNKKIYKVCKPGTLDLYNPTKEDIQYLKRIIKFRIQK